MDRGEWREWGEDHFVIEVLNFPGRAVVMFGDPRWSGPCRQTHQLLRRLAPGFPAVRVGLVNMSDSPLLCARFDARAMPTVVVFEAGQEARRVVGCHQEEEWRVLLGGEASARAED